MAHSSLTPFRSGAGLLGGDPFLSLYRDMNCLFEDAFRGVSPSGPGAAGESFLPAHMNVSEAENEIRITAELPGVSQDDVEVAVDDDVLTIRAEKRLEKKDEKERFHFVERTYGTFQRSLRLPFPVDPEQVRANFENGVLTVTLPKTKAQDRSRRIQIRGGSAAGQNGEAGGQGSGASMGSQGSGGSQESTPGGAST